VSIRIILISAGAFILLFLGLFIPGYNSKHGTAQTHTPDKHSATPAIAPYRPDEYFRYVLGSFRGSFAQQAALLAMRNKTTTLDSLTLGSSWARENELLGLSGFFIYWKARRTNSLNDYYEAAVDFIKAASLSGVKHQDQAAATEWMQSKICLDSALSIDPNHLPSRNALVAYYTEFGGEPMKGVAILKENEKMDSSNLETQYLYLSLLKKAGELDKAITRCQKIISLQPQNPEFLYEMSGLYGMKGDSLNAKLYLDLAIKMQRSGLGNP
jgi:tetratricopeptide (TPR) repeat protein